MTDRTALLRSVLERPEDDIPRLVIADWLEENAGRGRCVACNGSGFFDPGPDQEFRDCLECEGSGIASNDFAEQARFIRDCIWMHANHTDCPVRLVDLERGRPVLLRCGLCEYCTARRRAEKFYAKHIWLPGVNYAVCFEPSPLDGPIPTGPGLTLTVSKGFVQTVRCDLQSWVGGPCERCDGTGFPGGEPSHMMAHAPRLCRYCNATGRTPAHGPRIVAEQPVERVETPPRRHGTLLIEASEYIPQADGEQIPRNVFRLVKGGTPAYVAGGANCRAFDSEAAAQSALSLALVQWARREAGLPPLPHTR